MYENRDTHRSYKEFRDLDPVTKRLVRSIERIKDLDAPDRISAKNRAIGRTITRMRADLGTSDPDREGA